MNRPRLAQSKFWDKMETRHNRGLTPEEQDKILTKMLRELFHAKPPRGRSGRHLPQDEHICVEGKIQKWNSYYNTGNSRQLILTQGGVTPDTELFFLEKNKAHDNVKDLKNLRDWDRELKQQDHIRGFANNFNELVSGLMGMNLEDMELKTSTYGGQLSAVLKYEGFEIIIREVA